MRTILDSIEGEYRRYKGLAEGAFQQVSDSQLTEGPEEGNSIVIIVWHIAGNLRSRFSDFLTCAR